MFTWEYPPRIIGGIAPHVFDLSTALSEMKDEVIVVTCDFPGAPEREQAGNVTVHRVDSYKAPTPDFASWTYTMNSNLQRHAAELLASGESVDLIHAHDWLVAEAAIGLKHMFRIPMVATIHSTEHGRRNGIHSVYQRMIHETEVWLSREAWRVICCSDYMASHVNSVLGTPRECIETIPNGVDTEKFNEPFDREAFRRNYALPEEKLVLYVGRMVHEKGPGILVEAAKRVLSSINAKFVLVGEGYMRDALEKKVWDEGLGSKFFFTGFLEDQEVKLLYRIADVFVAPSLYEPFGIVCLEAMAGGAPVVVSNIGGLGEIVQHEKNGVKVYPNDSNSLAWGIMRVLDDQGFARRIAEEASRKVRNAYSWGAIAERTERFYEGILAEYRAGPWKPHPITK
jgi:glycosyltransferase involved in cell wall biosynthesis